MVGYIDSTALKRERKTQTQKKEVSRTDFLTCKQKTFYHEKKKRKKEKKDLADMKPSSCGHLGLLLLHRNTGLQ